MSILDNLVQVQCRRNKTKVIKNTIFEEYSKSVFVIFVEYIGMHNVVSVDC